MTKIHFVKVGGVKYPLSFSLYAAKEISEKYGTIENAFKIVNQKNDDAKKLDAFGYIAECLIRNGCEYCNELNIKPDGVLRNEYGEIEPITARRILLVSSFDEIEEFTKEIQIIFKEHQKKEINAYPSQGSGKSKKKKRR